MTKKTVVTLEERKQIMTEMLKALLNYCQKHDLRVYLCDGTLLGAVRHSGFIPWDDDMDVMMPIEDFERLVELTEQDKLPEPFCLSSNKRNPDHIWPYLKLIDTRTELVERVITKKLQKAQARYFGVYIDIFPMYGLPDTRQERLQYQRELCAAYDKLKKATRVMNRRPTDSWLLFTIRRILYFVYCLPYKIVGKKQYIKKMYKLYHRYPLEQAEKFGHEAGLALGEREHFDMALLNEVITLKFEDVDCPVFADYHTVLKSQYGDYMKLPPESERHTHACDAYWRDNVKK